MAAATEKFQSPSHRGPCARRGYRPCAPTITDRFQSPSHRGPRARRSPPSPSRTSSVGFSPLLIGGRARGGRTRRNTPHTHNRFSPLLIGGRARGTLHAALRAILMYQFQSPSHKGPRARRERRLPQYPAHNPFQSPSHRGPRARRSRRATAEALPDRFSPLLIGGRARGGAVAALRGQLGSEFQSPSHRGPRARHFSLGAKVSPLWEFQSPSHRGPRARLDLDPALAERLISFSPLLIGGRARGRTATVAKQRTLIWFQSPSHRGPRARLDFISDLPASAPQVSVPFS